LESGLEQHLRDRFRAVDAVLELILPSEPEAGIEEAALVDHRVRRRLCEAVGHDAIGLEERTQHAVRAERARALDQLVCAVGAARELLLPIRIALRELAPQLAAERVAVREEELEL